jgi:hypothetical protein
MPELTYEALAALMDGACLAVHVPAYCEEGLASRLGAWFAKHESLSPYDHELRDGEATRYAYFGVDRVGFPLNKTWGTGRDANLERYMLEALPAMRRVRQACAPALCPVDRLRLELDELWPDGAQVASFVGKKMFVGIGRVMRPENSRPSEEVPHFDRLPPEVHRFERQFGANVYLSVPDSGGELEIWDVLGQNGLTRADLPPPAVTLRPALGDLVILDVRRMHAVRAFRGALRVSVQSCIGFEPGKPLQLWN